MILEITWISLSTICDKSSSTALSLGKTVFSHFFSRHWSCFLNEVFFLTVGLISALHCRSQFIQVPVDVSQISQLCQPSKSLNQSANVCFSFCRKISVFDLRTDPIILTWESQQTSEWNSKSWYWIPVRSQLFTHLLKIGRFKALAFIKFAICIASSSSFYWHLKYT